MEKDSNNIELVVTLIGQIQGLYDEVTVLSKGKPDNPLNSFKVKLINEKIAEANAVLVEKYQPLKSFTVFDDSALPTNSDVVIVLSQYLARLKALRLLISSQKASKSLNLDKY